MFLLLTFNKRNKLGGNKDDILFASETKLDVPSESFILNEFTQSCWLDRKKHDEGLMVFVRKEILSKLLPNVNLSRKSLSKLT